MNENFKNFFPSEEKLSNVLKELNLKKSDKLYSDKSPENVYKSILCPTCRKYSYKLSSGHFKCSSCVLKNKFNEKTGTIFQGIQMSLNQAVAIVFFNSLNTKDEDFFSIVDLASYIGVSSKSVGKFIQKINFIEEYESLMEEIKKEKIDNLEVNPEVALDENNPNQELTPSQVKLKKRLKKLKLGKLNIPYNKILLKQIIKYCKADFNVQELIKIIKEDTFSFLTYPGSKAKMFNDLEKRLPKSFNNFYEIFAGGLSFFFGINIKGIKSKKEDREFFISDNNQGLVNLYTDVRDNLEKFYEIYTKYATNFNSLSEEGKDRFWKIAKNKYNNNTVSQLECSVIFLFLSKTCFKGALDFTKDGKIQASCNKKANCSLSEDSYFKIKRCSEILQKNVTIKCQSFEEIEDMLKPGDFVLCDSPYILQKENTIDYGSDLVTPLGQKRIRDFLLRINKKGVYFIANNYKDSYLDFLYADETIFNMETIKVSRGISGDGRREAEIIIKNYK